MSVTKLHRLITSRPWTKQSLKHVCFTRYTGVYGNKQSLIIVYGKYYTLNKYHNFKQEVDLLSTFYSYHDYLVPSKNHVSFSAHHLSYKAAKTSEFKTSSQFATIQHSFKTVNNFRHVTFLNHMYVYVILP